MPSGIASSPKGGSFCSADDKVCSFQQKYIFPFIAHKAPPSGELARKRLRGFSF